MKKYLIIMLMLLMVGIGCFAQEAVEPVKKGFLSGLMDWNTILNIVLGIIGLFGGVAMVFWKKAKVKIREAGELLIKFADAVDDDKVNANEKTDLSAAARKLISKE